jgi:HAD superfamily hydrolase (TIGR01450 family)
MSFFDLYAFDLDGTLYRGNEVIPGSIEVIEALIREESSVLYVSNNSSLHVDDYVSKLSRMGFPVEKSWVRSSAIVTAEFLLLEEISTAFVVGEPGLVRTLRDSGIDVINANDDGFVSESDSRADVVVSGICRTRLSYGLLNSAMQQVRQGSRFVATNRDSSFPLENSMLAPGSGATVAFLETCIGQVAELMGKPKPEILSNWLVTASISANRCLVVGDRNDTDIACGIACGAKTALVRTGVDQTSDSATFVIDSLEELLRYRA